MAITGKRRSPTESLATISNVLLSAFIVASLYFGRELLVPLALAVLLTFILAPLVTWLQRWLGRIGAVLLVVAMMFTATGAVGWVLTRQAIDLANRLPSYRENIQTKLRSIPTSNRGPFSKITKTIEDLKKDHLLAEAVYSSALARVDTSKSDIYGAYPILQVLAQPNLPAGHEQPRRLYAFVAGVIGTLFSMFTWGLAWLQYQQTTNRRRKPSSTG